MKPITLAIFLIIAFLPALTGMLFRPGEWYAQLIKPAWTPPNEVFAPVWTILYVTIGIAGYLAWNNSTGNQRHRPFPVYGLQLLLNGLWTWLFFALHQPAWALLNLAALWSAVILNIVLFYRLNHASGMLLIPYFLWISYALFLNAAIVRLN